MRRVQLTLVGLGAGFAGWLIGVGRVGYAIIVLILGAWAQEFLESPRARRFAKRFVKPS